MLVVSSPVPSPHRPSFAFSTLAQLRHRDGGRCNQRSLRCTPSSVNGCEMPSWTQSHGWAKTDRPARPTGPLSPPGVSSRRLIVRPAQPHPVTPSPHPSATDAATTTSSAISRRGDARDHAELPAPDLRTLRSPGHAAVELERPPNTRAPPRHRPPSAPDTPPNLLRDAPSPSTLGSTAGRLRGHHTSRPAPPAGDRGAHPAPASPATPARPPPGAAVRGPRASRP